MTKATTKPGKSGDVKLRDIFDKDAKALALISILEDAGYKTATQFRYAPKVDIVRLPNITGWRIKILNEAIDKYLDDHGLPALPPPPVLPPQKKAARTPQKKPAKPHIRKALDMDVELLNLSAVLGLILERLPAKTVSQ